MVRTWIAYVILTALMSMLLVGVVGVSHGHGEHHDMSSGSDCPLMAHDDAVCLMSVFDHLALLRTLFEAALPSLLTIVLIGSAVALVYRAAPKWRWRWERILYTVLRWRRFVSARFSFRQYQDLFAAGILHPKLYL